MNVWEYKVISARGPSEEVGLRSLYLLDLGGNYRFEWVSDINRVGFRVDVVTKNENCSKVKTMDMMDGITEKTIEKRID